MKSKPQARSKDGVVADANRPTPPKPADNVRREASPTGNEDPHQAINAAPNCTPAEVPSSKTRAIADLPLCGLHEGNGQ